jgi:hypothetical protein
MLYTGAYANREREIERERDRERERQEKKREDKRREEIVIWIDAAFMTYINIYSDPIFICPLTA